MRLDYKLPRTEKYLKESVFRMVNNTISGKNRSTTNLKPRRFYLFNGNVSFLINENQAEIECTVQLNYIKRNIEEIEIYFYIIFDIQNRIIHTSYDCYCDGNDDFEIKKKYSSILNKYAYKLNDSLSLIDLCKSEMSAAGDKIDYTNSYRYKNSIKYLRDYLFDEVYPRIKFVSTRFPNKNINNPSENTLYCTYCDLSIVVDILIGKHIRMPIQKWHNNMFYNLDVILVLNNNHEVINIHTDSMGFEDRKLINNFCHLIENGDNGNILKKIDKIIKEGVIKNSRNSKIEDLLLD